MKYNTLYRFVRKLKCITCKLYCTHEYTGSCTWLEDKEFAKKLNKLAREQKNRKPVCYRCRHEIVDSQATGCPHCHVSFVE